MSTCTIEKIEEEFRMPRSEMLAINDVSSLSEADRLRLERRAFKDWGRSGLDDLVGYLHTQQLLVRINQRYS